jgi:hypothetical protein
VPFEGVGRFVVVAVAVPVLGGIVHKNLQLAESSSGSSCWPEGAGQGRRPWDHMS